ncbi:unnamed protein product, partial [Rotaria magnacalcarata]
MPAFYFNLTQEKYSVSFGAKLKSFMHTEERLHIVNGLLLYTVTNRDVHGGATAAAAAAAPLPPWRQRRGSGNFFSFTVAARRGS